MKTESPQHFLGIMSGTSLDGLDVVLLTRSDDHIQVGNGHTYPYPVALRQDLLRLCGPSQDELSLMMSSDIALGQFVADSVMRFLEKEGLNAADITAIGSHGQTIRHLPDGKYPNTLQIGDPNTIAQRTGITTVADFRRRDMAAGGQGAPLVPAFHQAMLHAKTEDRVVLNIGGIANITVLPANEHHPVTGFDTGPGNVLMDIWHQRHHGGHFDENGDWANQGSVDDGLLHRMLEEPYFVRQPPKSTGRELFHYNWLQPYLDGHHLEAADVQATLSQFTATTIMQAIEQHAPSTRRVLVCGGGVHNLPLMQRLRSLAGDNRVVESTAAHGIDPDCMEGACFAWMASQTLRHLPANLPSVTGAKGPVILGAIYPGH
ncbi:MAG: anhydro-N-acetylmuramic acid kinase [Gammaproteobacteria bacterium]|nr:anhydro-N-acetylmuramic acid kinase [Gammaproteobacteria bacterium]